MMCSILSFWLIEGPWDKAYEWTTLSASDRATIKSQYNAAGIKLLVAAFGSTDVPTSSGADPVTTANNLASFVKTYGLDGVDVDYEVGLFPRSSVSCNELMPGCAGLQRYGWRHCGGLAHLVHDAASRSAAL